MTILDIGCGKRKRAGAVGLDVNPESDADVIHDLNQFPYPFEDSTFDDIFADNVLEHLDDVIKVMEELLRISKPGGITKIIVPFFRAKWAFIDPTHKHFFTVNSFSYFDPKHIHNRLYNYSKATFSVEKVIFNETLRCSMPKTILKLIANRWPEGYESYISHLCPLDDLTFYLRTLK